MKTNTWDCFDPCRAIHFAGIKKSTHQYALYDFNEFLHLGQTVYIYEGTGRLVWILVGKFQAISDVYILYSLPELCKHLYFCVFFMFLFLFSLFAFGVFLLVNLYLISWYIKLLCVVTPSRNQGSKTMQIKTHPQNTLRDFWPSVFTTVSEYDVTHTHRRPAAFTFRHPWSSRLLGECQCHLI